MKTPKKDTSITGPLLKDMIESRRQCEKLENPTVGSEPLQASALYQDPGSGYNSDIEFIQQ